MKALLILSNVYKIFISKYNILFKLPSRFDFLRLSVISSICQNNATAITRFLKFDILNKKLILHFFHDSYTFSCIFCQASPLAYRPAGRFVPRNTHASGLGLGTRLVLQGFSQRRWILIRRRHSAEVKECHFLGSLSLFCMFLYRVFPCSLFLVGIF